MGFQRAVLVGLMLAVAHSAVGQEVRQTTIFLKAVDGYLAVDRARTQPDLSGYAGQDVLRTLLDDVDLALRQIGRLCNQALKLAADAECPAAGNGVARLTQPDWHAVRTAWTAWQQQAPAERPTIDSVFRDIEN